MSLFQSGTKRKASEPHDNSGKRSKFKGRGEKRAKAAILCNPQPDWHALELPPLPESNTPDEVPKHLVEELYNHALALLDEETEQYRIKQAGERDSSRRFLDTVMSTGTQEDKISALTLAVQESPLHNRRSLESLVAMAKKRSRNQAMPALSAIVDLMAEGSVLPENRRLRYFAKNTTLLETIASLKAEGVPIRSPFSHLPKPLEKTHLIYFSFEDQLKKAFFEVVQALEMWCNDEVEYSRSRSLGLIYNLLTSRPEQEENLLLLLVNKLGDRSKKIASRASYLLGQLQTKHPLMKPIIVKTIESEVLFKPGQHQSAKYYAIITLNQTILSRQDTELANKLISIYIGLFLAILKATENDDDTPAEPAKKEKKSKKTKAGQRARKRQADELANKEANEKLVAQVLTGINRAFPFADTTGSEFESHLNTIYRIAHSSNFNTAIQAMMLLFQISTAKNYSLDRFYRLLYESLLDPRLHRSSKQVMYLNLLYRALKSDLSVKRVKAFVKRLLQVATAHEPAFACAVLYLVSELIKTFPGIGNMRSEAEERPEETEERFVDVDEDAEGQSDEEAESERMQKELARFLYDNKKRDPEQSNAEKSCLWELIPFQTHFHPSVALFGSSILHDKKVPPKPDPTLHTLIHFLDKFVYRGARTARRSSVRGSSIMQPLAGSEGVDILVRNRAEGRTRAPLNDPTFWSKKVEEIPAEEVFFHKYFHQSGKAAEAKKKQKSKSADGDESGSDGDDDEIWQALVNSKPEIEGDDGAFFSDDDVDLSGADFESDEDGDEADGFEGFGSDGREAELVDVFHESGSDGEESDDFGGSKLDLGSDGDSDDGSGRSDLEDVLALIQDGDMDIDSDLGQAGPKSDAAAAAAESGSGSDTPKKPVNPRAKERKERRKKLRDLPTFASAEDYAALIDAE